MPRTQVKAHRRGGRMVRSHSRRFDGNRIRTVGGSPDSANAMGRAYDGLKGGPVWMDNRSIRQSEYYRMLQKWDSLKQTKKAKAINGKTNNPRQMKIKQILTPDNDSQSA